MATRATLVAPAPSAIDALPARRRLRGSPVVISAVLLTVLVAGTFVTGQAGRLLLAFPAAAALLGAWVLARQPVPFIGYAWWIWFLTPFVRRLCDVQSGWHQENPISLTPMLVTALLLPSLLRHAPKFRHRALFAYPFMVLGIFYGWVVGMLGRPSAFAATYAAVTWVVPLMLGAKLTLEWRRYPEYRDVIGRTFLWGALLMGIYGVFQFVSPPEWDRYWMIQSDMDSIGQPVPFDVRVFSVLNAPGPFAYVIEAGLLMLLAVRARGRALALVAGTAGLVLSLVRSAWLGITFGLLLYLAYAPWRQPGRRFARAMATLIAVFTLTLFAAELVPVDPIVETATRRLETLRNLSSDVSYRARTGSMRAYVRFITEDFTGEGLGSTGTSIALTRPSTGIRDFDNGLLEVFYALGWPGGVLYLAGVLWIVLPLLRKGEERWDDFSRATRAGGVALLLQAVFGNVFVNVSAAAMWTCFGLLAASRRYARETVAPR